MTSHIVKRTNLGEVVAAGIRKHIIERRLGPGDRLPTEQEMAQLLGVSRVTVREAIKALSLLGIIRSAPRRGLTVGSVDMRRVTDCLGFLFAVNNYPREQLVKTRLAIETCALAETADNIAGNRAFFDKLMAINYDMEKAVGADTVIKYDVAFHRALLEASGIEPLIAFNDLIEIFFHKLRTAFVRAGPNAWAVGVAGHRQIAEALRDGKVDKAAELLRGQFARYRETEN